MAKVQQANREEERITERKFYVKHIVGHVLRQYRADVTDCDMSDSEIVTIRFKNGAERKTDVHGEGFCAIARAIELAVM